MTRWALALAVLVVTGCQAEVPMLTRSTMMVGGKAVQVEVADDAGERELGLMYRKTMDENEGMLFVWPDSGRRVFWMKNTYLPLDMLFIDGGKVVGVIANAKPLDETPLDPGVDSSYVLEVNAGWAQAHGVSVGSAVEIGR